MKILEILTERRKTGNAGELAAKKFYKKNGYKILKTNYVAVGYEIDIIAQNKEYTVFCEVKTRTLGKENLKEPRPASSVTQTKQRKIITAAKCFLGTIKRGRKIRFDVIEVFLDDSSKVSKLNFLEAAFNFDTAYQR